MEDAKILGNNFTQENFVSSFVFLDSFKKQKVSRIAPVSPTTFFFFLIWGALSMSIAPFNYNILDKHFEVWNAF